MMLKHTTNKEQNDNDDLFFSFKILRGIEDIKEEQANNGEEEVINIYHQNMPKQLERESNKGLKIFLAGIFIFIISSALFYYYGKSFFSGVNIFSGNNVNLKIEAISQIAAGEKITYTIKYENLEKIDLSDVVLKAVYPDGFVYEKSRPVPTDENNNSWDLGYLRSGKSGQIEIAGSLIGAENAIKKFNVKLTYNLGNDRSTGNKEAEIETKIASSVLTVDISGPSQVFDDEVEYKITYFNQSYETVKDIQIFAIYPENFIFIDSQPIQPQEKTENAIWLINQLDGRQSKELLIKGKFESQKQSGAEDNSVSALSLADDDVEAENFVSYNVINSGVKKIFKIQIGILSEDDIFFQQAEKELVINIASGDIAVSLKLNNSAENSIIKLDDILTYNVSYINQSGLNFQDVKIKLIINSNILDWGSLENTTQGIVEDEEIINGMLARSIMWNIKEIKAGDEGDFLVKFRTKPYSKLDKTNSLDLRAEARVKTIIGKIDGESSNKAIESDKIIAQVNTELNLDARADFLYQNEYEIVWQLTNTIHEVENIKVEAILPQETNWVSQSSISAGDLYFDPETKKASWQLNRIPVGIDTPLVAKFKLRAFTQRRPTLLTNFTLSAKDKITGSQIIKNFADIMGE